MQFKYYNRISNWRLYLVTHIGPLYLPYKFMSLGKDDFHFLIVVFVRSLYFELYCPEAEVSQPQRQGTTAPHPRRPGRSPDWHSRATVFPEPLGLRAAGEPRRDHVQCV